MFLALYNHPTKLLRRASAEQHFWWRLWLVVAAPSLVLAGATVGFAVVFAPAPPAMMIGYGLLPLVALMPGIAIAVTTTGHARLWLLYACAPPAAAAALLAGAGPAWPGGWLLSGTLLTPALLGLLVVCGCAVDLYNRDTAFVREQQRRRQNNERVVPPVPGSQNRARTIRIALAGAAVTGAALVQLLFLRANPRDGFLVGLALLVFALACVRAEATLCCLFGGPLVIVDSQGAPHVAYAGRWALFVPQRALSRLLAQDAPPATTGALVAALLREGCLAPPIRRATARLTSAEGERVALGLSLCSGGMTILRYLAPAFPPALRNLSLLYAVLAEQAALPKDLQRWLEALDGHPGAEALPSAFAEALAAAGAALRCHEDNPAFDRAVTLLQRQITLIYGAADVPHDSGWPLALQERVRAHRRLLQQQVGSEGSP